MKNMIIMLLAVAAAAAQETEPVQVKVKTAGPGRPPAALRQAGQPVKARVPAAAAQSPQAGIAMPEALLSSPLPFVPVTPCRVVDTRSGQGKTGSFGPPSMEGGSTRTVPIPQGTCGIPGNASAYSLNVTVVPQGPLSYLTIWPTGSPQPLVSTLNSFDGAIVANAAIVPAGTNGSVNIFVTNRADVIVDINGYFGSSGTPVQFYSTNPCRVVDTRASEGKTGAFGPPVMSPGETRTIPIPQGTCGIPASARAYSVNVTVVPRGPLSFLSIWPYGQAQPLVSTLNSFTGRVVANAALVPAGTNGAINVYVTDFTEVIIDINGYLAP